MNEIVRFRDSVTITAASSAATSTPRIAFGNYAGGCVLIAATGGATQISWYGASASDAAPVQIYADGSAVTTAVTVGGHAIPDACFALPFVVPVISGGTSCSINVHLKG